MRNNLHGTSIGARGRYILKTSVWSYLRGCVKLQIRGEGQEELINRMAERRMTVWDVRVTKEGHIELVLHLSDFFRIRELLKQTSCRMHVMERHGLPFVLSRVEKRKFFVVGAFLFIVGLYLLSSVVWKVDIVGNERIDRQTVLEAARKHGIYPMQWKFRMGESSALSNKLMNELPGTAWIGVKVRGTHVEIEIVEAKEPEKKPLLSPRNLVSKSDAVITKIFAEQGRPMVVPNQRVRRGDMLISGELGEGEARQIVVAKGRVFGLVWHEMAIEVPMSLKYKAYTGETKTKQYVVLGDYAIQLTGYGKNKFTQKESTQSRKGLSWRNVKLPVGWMKEKIMEVEYIERKLDKEEAKAAGLEQAKAHLLSAIGSETVIRDQKILHEKTESGKVYMKVLFEVEQEIGSEQPIVNFDSNSDQGE